MRDGYLRGAFSPQATQRQMDVLAAYVASGGSVQDAAELVGIRPSTVKHHLADLRARSGHTTEQLIYGGAPRDGCSCSEFWKATIRLDCDGRSNHGPSTVAGSQSRVPSGHEGSVGDLPGLLVALDLAGPEELGGVRV